MLALFSGLPVAGFTEKKPMPMRDVYQDTAQLEEFARALAGEHVVSTRMRRSRNLLNSLADDYRALNMAQRSIVEWVRCSVPLTRSVEWLLDNAHIINAQVREIRRNLPSSYYNELPKLVAQPFQAFPRVYGMAVELIAHSNSRLDEERIAIFVRGYQTDITLTSGELWALPIMLQIALVQNLQRLTSQIVDAQQRRSLADRWVDNVFALARKNPRRLEQILTQQDNLPERLDTVLAVQLLQRFFDQGTSTTALLRWLEARLARQGMTFDDATHTTHADEAANLESVGNCITSLRFVASYDWALFFESVSRLEAKLCEDPSGIYPLMDFPTRDSYRHVIEAIAKDTEKSEIEVATSCLELATEANTREEEPAKRRHIGYYLLDKGKDALWMRCCGRRCKMLRRIGNALAPHCQPLYPLAIIAVTVLIVATMLHLVQPLSGAMWWLALLLLVIPSSDLAMHLISWVVMNLFPPKLLPKLALKEGIPPEFRTVSVIHTMLTSNKRTQELVEQMEVYYLANQENCLHFAILCDFPDAAEQMLPDEHKLLDFARDIIQTLNDKYPAEETVFYLFYRQRQWNPVEGKWMGWERKRGKLEEFNRLLRGDTETSFVTLDGDLSVLQQVRYIITLDEDTQLPRDAAKRLVGTLAHPLNHAILNAAGTRVIEGYGVLQPRVSIAITSARRSLFASIYAGQTGIDPYPTAVSDTYQDLFGEGIYMGKGIYELDTFMTVLDGTFPENSVLSHDLLEGSHIRAGMVTDVEMVDSFPAHYLAAAARMHRWIRGDWQLIPWLFRMPLNAAGERVRNPLTLISRWKIIDNLRRSLVPPAVFTLLVAGMTILPGEWRWLCFTLLVLATPIILYVTDDLRTNWALCLTGAFRWLFPHLKMMNHQLLLSIILLPHQAYVMSDAIVRTIYRLLFTRSLLLDWETAASAESRMRVDARGYHRAMWPALALALGAIAGILLAAPGTVWWLSPILMLWLLSPYVAWMVSQKSTTRPLALSAGDKIELLKLAQNTWSYFADNVGIDDHFLPPDNYQEQTDVTSTTSTTADPLAHRTSPTNIGMYLLSALAACDLKFITPADFLNRVSNTVETLEGLPRYYGHWYNWYNTQTKELLSPRYISTVDSGNLAGCFIVLKQGIDEFLHLPDATLALAFAVAPDSADLPQHLAEIKDECRSLMSRLTVLVMEMDYKLLFDAKRQLFHIGFQVETATLDDAYYDLLASEARIASFLAIAKGDIEEKHWFRLGRQLTQSGDMRALLSWSGTMFEYLMPLLVMRNYPGTLLDETYMGVVKRQQDYGAETGLPWGVSESGFNARDQQFNYQYLAFGTPGLGLKRGLAADRVVAPYATVLALMVDPAGAMRNITLLKSKGMENKYGMYEALDYTTERVPRGEKFAIVRSVMAHHQGMSLLSIDNVLQNNIMQERFHAEPMVRATELLLQERLPRHASLVENAKADDVACRIVTPIEVPIVRQFTTGDTPEPEGQLLSNGHYSVLLTAAGGGFSSCDGMAVTRWRSDPTSDMWGSFCYIRDIENDLLWSTTSHPLDENKTKRVSQPEEYTVTFANDHVEYSRHDGDFTTRMEVTVSPEHNVEVRRISITNNGRKLHRLELTSYNEIALAPLAADLAHPAFSKLFVSTEHVERKDALLCTRRPRTPQEKTPVLFHVLAFEGNASGHIRYETDRSKFLGRTRDVTNPVALDPHHRLTNSLGSVLDPVLSLRRRVHINPGETIRIYISMGVATDRADALSLVEQYHQTEIADRAFVRAWTHSQIELRYLQMSAEKAHLAQRIACRLLYPHPQRRMLSESITRNKRGQASLWPMGISGDLPILLVSVNREEETDIVREALQIHSYLRYKGLASDLVIVNEQRGGYLQPLRDRLRSLLNDSQDRNMENRPGGVFMIQHDIVGEEEFLILSVAARVTLKGSTGTLKAQMDAKLLELPLPRRFRQWGFDRKYPDEALPYEQLIFENGLGGFTADGREYIINLTAGVVTPAPWVNVLANPDFGCIISESGAGYTWADNCHEHRITPWSNDPVCDSPGEVVYIRDEDSGCIWTTTPAPIREAQPYRIRHGQGYTTFEHHSHGCRQLLTVFVPTDGRAKIYRLQIRNDSGRKRNLSVTGYVEWVLGTDRQFTRPFVVTDVDTETGIQTARNAYQNEGFASRVAFLDIVGVATRTYTGDRTEFIGRNGQLRAPLGLTRFELGGRVGAGYDPCAAAQVKFTLNPDEEKEIDIVIGEADDLPGARQLASRFRIPGAVAEAQGQVRQYWDDKLNTVQITTPDPALDILINRWLLYQTVSSRLWARSGFYQSGGAYGFRDQLQDVMSLVYTDPGQTRTQLLRAAARQFLEGDVQHWWHLPAGAGVRTRCSDDYLWLPYVTADYVATTADIGVLDEQINYLDDKVLEAQEEDRYNIPSESAIQESLYQHCLRALDRGIKLVGAHGLPLIGSGDWNDGMNLVGNDGKGESIWLGWFLTTTLMRFADICTRHGDSVKADGYRREAAKITTAIEKHGWDGEWYRRAYTDEGIALGSAQNTECRIDSIAQSWAVISGGAQPDRAKMAMDSLAKYLLRSEEKLTLLLTPPFDKSTLEPGYIKGYPVGVRENGGQYTHAAMWVALAASRQGNGSLAAKLLAWLNPIYHSSNAADVEKYKVEPYVIAADIYGVAPHLGRGGWTWYTGSSAWMYRVAVESMLGLHMVDGELVINPCIPAEWPECTITYQYFSTKYIIQVDNPFNVNCGAMKITLNDEPLPGGRLTRVDDGRVHYIRVLLGY